MSVLEVARLTLRQNRRGSIGWVVGIAGITLLYGSSYTSVAGAKAAAIDNYSDSLKRALNLQDFGSASGYLNATVFGIPLLVLTTLFAVSWASREIAGEEESGVLDLLMAHPITRTGLVLGRFAAMAVVLVGMGVVMFAVVLVLREPTGLSIGAAEVAAATFTWFLFGACLGAVSLFVSALVGRRGATLAISAGLAVSAYLAASFLPLVDHLGWIRDLSPYYWFIGGDPLKNGLQVGFDLLLGGVVIAATCLAAAVFNRRDLHV